MQQAELAKQAGIEGFCYYDYWFGNGKRLMERPITEVINSQKPNFPFCFAWANHSWYKKLWDPKQPGKDKLLIKQEYPGIKDYTEHFYTLLPAFKDNRYVKVNGKLFQKIGYPDTSKNEEKEPDDKISLNDIINEKGELI